MTEPSPVTLVRRLGAVLYDLLPLFALLGLATAPWMLLQEGQAVEAGTLTFQLYLLAWIAGYFVGSWAFGGQTIGMRAWQFRVVSDDGTNPTWQALLVRLVTALGSWVCLGLGFLSALWHPDKLAWHDRLSHTRLISTKAAKR